ncbi:granzyme-like protein 1 [Lissotriton helveticus]
MQGFAAEEARMLLSLALAWIGLLSQAHGGVLQDAIIGGHEARSHSRPYMAALIVRNKFTCGGFLVRKDFVMTAAHCKNKNLEIILGAHNIKKEEESQQRVKILNKFLHPEYNPRTFANDIMLLQLKSKVELNKYVKTIPLPSASRKVKVADNCNVAGWGKTGLNESYPDKLQEVNLKVVPGKACKNFSKGFDEESMICAGDRDVAASFKGDSGGPLICRNVLQGIVSHGLSTGRPPRIFTKISHFIPWIKKIFRQSD